MLRQTSPMAPEPASPATGGVVRELHDRTPPMITQVISIVRRRRWVIVGAVAAALMLGLALTLLITPKYTASATLEIQRETGSFVKIDGVEQKDNVLDQEFYQTQYGLLQSQTLAEKVAADLRLADDPKFFELFGVRTTKMFPNGRARPGAAARAERLRTAGEVLLDNFVVKPERLSRLVAISFTSADRVMSKRVVDAWSADFIKITLDRRFEATSYARNFLETRLAQLRTRIDESQRKLVDYASRESIVNLPAVNAVQGENGATPERPLLVDDLTALNDELSKATADRVKAESRLNSRSGETTEALTNDAISTLRQKRAELSADYAKLMAQFEPQYPPALALKSQIDQLDASIGREESRVKNTISQDYTSASRREGDLQKRVGALKTGVLDLRRRSIQYDIFRRDVDTNQQLYDALLQRYKEIGVAGGVGVNNIAIVDQAQLPERPSSPKLVLNMVLALMVGLIVGGAAAFLLEQTDQGITDPGDVEVSLGVPLLGTIPKVEDGHLTEALQDIKSSVSEAYLSLQTNLSFSTDHGVARSLAVTSTRPAEGKSTTTFALARSLARTRRRVVLVDADLRSPSVHHLMDMDNARGLSNYLAGDDELAGLVRNSAFENLAIVTAGPQPPSAPELLSSDRFPRLIQLLLETYDHVIFDAPPVMGLADAPLVASQVEGVVFVLESDATQKSMAQVALDRLQNSNANMLGVVLTKFDAKRAHYGYGYDYGYGYGYGDRGGEHRADKPENA